MKKIFFVLIVLSIFLPIVIIILLSIFSYYRYPLLLPKNFTTIFWKTALFQNSLFISSLLNSVILGVCNGLLSTIVGIMTARVLVRYEFKGKKIVNMFFTIPLFIPAMALFLGIHSVMINFRLVNTYLGIILAHMIISIPYSTIIFISFFQGINNDMEDAAKVLGCKPFSLFVKIILPLITPGIYLSFSIGFLISSSEYFSTFIISGGKVISLSTIMYSFVSNSDLGNGSVLVVVFISINVLFFLLSEYISRKKLKIQNYLYE